MLNGKYQPNQSYFVVYCFILVFDKDLFINVGKNGQ